MMQLESQQYLPAPTHVLECIEKWRNLDLRKMEDSEVDAELSNYLDDLGKYFSNSRIGSDQGNQLTLTEKQIEHHLLKGVRRFVYPEKSAV